MLLLCSGMNLWAQHKLIIRVNEAKTKEAIIGATIRVDGLNLGAKTNASGIGVLPELPSGFYTLHISCISYETKEVIMNLPHSDTLFIVLDQVSKEMEEVVISSTRTNSRLEKSPIKVEVLGMDDMLEENTIKPGNVASILGDISSIQIQQTNASTANSNVRIQGLNGKYTQMLRDGFPQYDGFAGNFGVLQIPPLDLKQIEIIKGSASTLYGGDAIAGIIHFISKTPGEKAEQMFTLNQSSLLESNANMYLSKRTKRFGYTLFAGGTRQLARDVNKDGFSDVPEMRSVNLHPRFFIYGKKNQQLVIGYNGMNEYRRGGDMQVLQEKSDSNHTYFHQAKTRRHSVDMVYTKPIGKNLLTIKAGNSWYTLNQVLSGLGWELRQSNLFSEASYLIHRMHSDIVCGLNVKSVSLRSKNQPQLLNLYPQNATLGFFAQHTLKWKDHTTLQSGIRTDRNSTYGWFVLPSIAFMHSFHPSFYMRSNVGLGYKNPSSSSGPLQYALQNNIINSARAERSLGGNVEGNFHKRFSSSVNLVLNETFFFTNIFNPAVDSTQAQTTTIYNASKGVKTKGWDTYMRLEIHDIEIYAGYTYTQPIQQYNTTQPYIPLTPLHRFASTVVYEIEGKWRFGIESSWNGRQYLNDGSQTRSYWLMAAMIERKFKHIGLVLNCENLNDFRQNKIEHVVLPPYNNPSFKPIWAPLDGRVVNLSLVWKK